MLKLRINPIVAKDVEIYRVINRYQNITRIFD